MSKEVYRMHLQEARYEYAIFVSLLHAPYAFCMSELPRCITADVISGQACPEIAPATQCRLSVYAMHSVIVGPRWHLATKEIELFVSGITPALIIFGLCLNSLFSLSSLLKAK
jgi:hypothetical protein